MIAIALTIGESADRQLTGTEEIENGKSNGQLGEVFIRCNNVLYVRYASHLFITDHAEKQKTRSH